MKGIGVILLVGMIILLGNQAVAATSWYLCGYGKYNLSSSGFNEFVNAINSWTQNVAGLTDFAVEELDEEVTIYFIGNTWNFSSPWEIELSTAVLSPATLSDSGEEIVSLGGGGQSTLRVEGGISYYVILYALTGRYLFRSASKLTPFVKAGLAYTNLGVNGYCYAYEELYTPPWNYEYSSFYQSFSVHGSRLAYVLGAGVDGSLGKYLRLGLELKRHWIPTMKCQVDVQNEGFSSPPPVGPQVEIDLSGMSYGLYLMFHF